MAATSRLARFISEACPPQFVSVMRRRSPKVLDTINEEDHREALSSSSSLKIDKFSVSSLPSTMAASPPSPATSAAVSSKYFLNQVPLRSFSLFEHWDSVFNYFLFLVSMAFRICFSFLRQSDRVHSGR